MRDENNYIGTTINRTARIRDLGHGGQTVLSGATEEIVADHLPPDAWLLPLGTHQLRGLRRPERVIQLVGSELVIRWACVEGWVIHFPAAVCASSPSMPGSLRLIPDRTRGPG